VVQAGPTPNGACCIIIGRSHENSGTSEFMRALFIWAAAWANVWICPTARVKHLRREQPAADVVEERKPPEPPTA